MQLVENGISIVNILYNYTREMLFPIFHGLHTIFFTIKAIRVLFLSFEFKKIDFAVGLMVPFRIYFYGCPL